MMKFFRTLITLAVIGIVVAAVYLFIKTERLDKQLNEIKPRAEANFSDWEKQNNCLEDPLPCADYSTQFKNWLSQFELYKESKEKTPQFQAYLFLKGLDELYAPPNLNSGGKATLALSCVFVLLWLFLISRLLGEKKKPRIPSIKTRISFPAKLSTQTLLRKATKCAENEPAQAINYLEQALEGSLSTKLAISTLLMCGSLRLKNKIGKEQGKKQLNKVMSDSPESQEAQKAKTVLDTFE
jgi:hypothetical protein